MTTSIETQSIFLQINGSRKNLIIEPRDDRTGRIMNPSLAEYHLPVQADVPHIDIVYTDVADPLTPLGAHGVGEIGITGVATAIANAIYHATGKRITSLPTTLDKLL